LELIWDLVLGAWNFNLRSKKKSYSFLDKKKGEALGKVVKTRLFVSPRLARPKLAGL
jgi:hypothetical protein